MRLPIAPPSRSPRASAMRGLPPARADHERRDARQDRRALAEDPEERARVLTVDEYEQGSDDLDRLADLQAAGDRGLRRLIGRDDCDRGEPEEAPSAPRATPIGVWRRHRRRDP